LKIGEKPKNAGGECVKKVAGKGPYKMHMFIISDAQVNIVNSQIVSLIKWIKSFQRIVSEAQSIYCVKCKDWTENKGKIMRKNTSNGHNYVTVKCTKFGTFKSSFTS
jgi:RNase P subunit RPR2